MSNKTIALKGLLHTAATWVYIGLVATLMFNTEHRFDNANGAAIGVAMLSLLVLSACVVGGLLIARPAMWYVDGKKTEALKLFFYTVGWMLAFTILMFAALAIFSSQA